MQIKGIIIATAIAAVFLLVSCSQKVPEPGSARMVDMQSEHFK